MIGTIRIVLVVAIAVAATLAANFVLMGVATGQQDPVGRLAPRAAPIGSTTTGSQPQPPPPATSRVRHGEAERDD